MRNIEDVHFGRYRGGRRYLSSQLSCLTRSRAGAGTKSFTVALSHFSFHREKLKMSKCQCTISFGISINSGTCHFEPSRLLDAPPDSASREGHDRTNSTYLGTWIHRYPLPAVRANIRSVPGKLMDPWDPPAMIPWRSSLAWIRQTANGQRKDTRLAAQAVHGVRVSYVSSSPVRGPWSVLESRRICRHRAMDGPVVFRWQRHVLVMDFW